MSDHSIVESFALLCAGATVGVAWSCGLRFARETLKAELRRRGWRVLVIGWRAFAVRPLWGPTFRAIYCDERNIVRSADCSLPNWRGPMMILKIRSVGGDAPRLHHAMRNPAPEGRPLEAPVANQSASPCVLSA